MAAVTLRGVDAKLAHAREHIDVFRQEAAEFLNGCQGLIKERIEGDGARHVYFVDEWPEPPDHWGPLIGDICHDLRSCLDQLAWQLVLLSGGTPNMDTTFPIRTPAQPDRGLQIQPGVRAELQELVEKIQHTGPDRLPALAVIHELNRVDKHRHLLPAVALLEGFSWFTPDHVEVRARAYHEPFPESGILLELHPTPPWPNSLGAQLRLGVRLTSDMESFVRVGDLPNWALNVGWHNTRAVVNRFRPFFD